MEIILIVLSGVVFGAINFGFYLLGQRNAKAEKDGVEISKENADKLNEYVEWINYNGRGNR